MGHGNGSVCNGITMLGNVKLCDFGLVFLVQGPEIDLNKILPTTKCGSIPYLPPEVMACEAYNTFKA